MVVKMKKKFRALTNREYIERNNLIETDRYFNRVSELCSFAPFQYYESQTLIVYSNGFKCLMSSLDKPYKTKDDKYIMILDNKE